MYNRNLSGSIDSNKKSRNKKSRSNSSKSSKNSHNMSKMSVNSQKKTLVLNNVDISNLNSKYVKNILNINTNLASNSNGNLSIIKHGKRLSH